MKACQEDTLSQKEILLKNLFSTKLILQLKCYLKFTCAILSYLDKHPLRMCHKLELNILVILLLLLILIILLILSLILLLIFINTNDVMHGDNNGSRDKQPNPI